MGRYIRDVYFVVSMELHHIPSLPEHPLRFVLDAYDFLDGVCLTPVILAPSAVKAGCEQQLMTPSNRGQSGKPCKPAVSGKRRSYRYTRHFVARDPRIDIRGLPPKYFLA